MEKQGKDTAWPLGVRDLHPEYAPAFNKVRFLTLKAALEKSKCSLDDPKPEHVDMLRCSQRKAGNP